MKKPLNPIKPQKQIPGSAVTLSETSDIYNYCSLPISKWYKKYKEEIGGNAEDFIENAIINIEAYSDDHGMDFDGSGCYVRRVKITLSDDEYQKKLKEYNNKLKQYKIDLNAYGEYLDKKQKEIDKKRVKQMEEKLAKLKASIK